MGKREIAFIKVVCAFLLTLAMSGCMYTNIEMPYDTDLDKTHLGSKTGEATAYSIFWAVAWGNAGTKAAADNGGITTINHADRKRFVVFFGAYAKETLVVYGD